MVGNVFSEQTQPLTASDIASLQIMSRSNVSETSDESGIASIFWNADKSWFEQLGTMVTLDFSFFYDYDPATGTSSPNDWMVVRYIILVPISIGIIFMLIYLLKDVLFGRR